MSKIRDLCEVPELPNEIEQAALDGNLVLFIGAGISRLLELPSWGGMALTQLEFLRDKELLNYSELDQLRKLDPKKQLSIVKEIADENGLILDLTKGLMDHSENDTIYKPLNDIGCVCVTTNYDILLSPRYSKVDDGSETSVEVNRIFDINDILVSHLEKPGSVIHLHGCVNDPESMIVTTRDYLKHYDNSHIQFFLGELFEKKTILFMGYGLEEAEILEHILRRGDVGDTKERKRFMLQGYFMSEKPLYEKLHGYYRTSYGVHMIGFIRDHKDYKQQEAIIKDWAPKIKVQSPSLTSAVNTMNKVLSNG